MKLLRDTVDKAAKWIGRWHHERYLKRMGWTQRQYDLNNDPDYNPRGLGIRRDMYHGYPHLIIFENAQSMNNRFGTWMDGLKQMSIWCEENTTGKWRDDILAVDYGYYSNELTHGVDGLSDQALIFAFKNEQDAIMFGLIWSM